MAELGRPVCGGTHVGVLVGAALLDWVTRSCLAQGVPVKVTDTRVLAKVRDLLGAGTAGHGRGVSADVPAGRRSKTPHRRDPGGVELSGARDPGADDGVVEDGLDDRSLAVEVEGRPLAS